jgi:uncharacterized membrane protein
VTATSADRPAGTGDAAHAVDSGPWVGRASALWIIIAGALGLASAFTLTVEKIEMLTDPQFVPSCNFNPVLSCGSIMATSQASVFGFPNPLIGIAAFTVVVTSGILAWSGVRLPRWYWVGLTIGTALGVVFIHWLIFESLYRIGALCPYCMVVWSVTIPLLVVVASIAARPVAGNPVLRVLHEWRWSIVAVWFTALILMILVRFWSYWSTLL